MKYGVQFFKKIKNFSFKKKRDGSGDYMNPLRDWALGLFFAVMIFACGVTAIMYDFYTQFGTVNIETKAEKKISYPETEIQNLADRFRSEEREFNDLKKLYQERLPVEPEPIEPAETEENTQPESLADTEDDEYTTPVPLSP